MSYSFWMCLAGVIIYLVILAVFMSRISRRKREMRAAGREPGKAGSPYVLSLILCALVEVLPFLIVLRSYLTVVVCLCGVIGEYLVLRERLETLGGKRRNR